MKAKKINRIDPAAAIGKVELTVVNLEGSTQFYQEVIGLQVRRREGSWAGLQVPGGKEILSLSGNPQAQTVRRTAGLYHFAIRVPSRAALARFVYHLVETNQPVQGTADHGVSEAVYLSDPEGNGIEVYRDRPRSEWSYADGQLQMTTEPLDASGLMAELETDGAWGGLEPATDLGHIHLKVTDIAAAEAFYTGVLGFELVTRYGSSASFVSAGGYHHHIGFNTWESAGAAPAPPDSTGLKSFSILLPGQQALAEVVGRIRTAGISLEEREDGLLVRDPSGNGVLLAVIE